MKQLQNILLKYESLSNFMNVTKNEAITEFIEKIGIYNKPS